MNKSQAAKVLGADGGKKGGPARARSLSKARRRQIAAQGAKARNAKYGNPKD